MKRREFLTVASGTALASLTPNALAATKGISHEEMAEIIAQHPKITSLHGIGRVFGKMRYYNYIERTAEGKYIENLERPKWKPDPEATTARKNVCRSIILPSNPNCITASSSERAFSETSAHGSIVKACHFNEHWEIKWQKWQPLMQWEEWFDIANPALKVIICEGTTPNDEFHEKKEHRDARLFCREGNLWKEV